MPHASPSLRRYAEAWVLRRNVLQEYLAEPCNLFTMGIEIARLWIATADGPLTAIVYTLVSMGGLGIYNP